MDTGQIPSVWEHNLDETSRNVINGDTLKVTATVTMADS